MTRYNWYYDTQSQMHSSQRGQTVKILIAVNVVSFFITAIVNNFNWYGWFGLVPKLVFSKLILWQFITYMFFHGGVWHLAINMLMLWFFGVALEQAWGKVKFLQYYFFTGIGAGLCSFAVNPMSLNPVVGASGAIFGLLVAYGLMFPETTVLVFFVFPMKMKQAVLLFGLMNLMGAVSTPNSGVAYFAHLGGALFGFWYLKSAWIRQFVSSVRFSPSEIKTKFNNYKKNKFTEYKNVNEQQVNMILDKITMYGVNSLTKEEREILNKRSKQR